MSPMSKESGFISEDIFDVSVLMASYRKSVENERSHRSEMRCEVLDENVCNDEVLRTQHGTTGHFH